MPCNSWRGTAAFSRTKIGVGNINIGPSSIKEGDVVGIIPGLPVPLVLRPQGSRSCRGCRIEIDKLLSSLPTNLSEIFDEIWSRVAARKDESRAKMIFSWILCAFRPFTIRELEIAMAHHDYDAAMQSKFAHLWRFEWAERFRKRPFLESPLDEENVLDSYLPIDLVGDLSHMFGPLVYIEDMLDLEGREQSRKSSHVTLCQLSVRDHFLSRLNFIDEGRVHFQMAVLCARHMDRLVTGDPDRISAESLAYDGVTILDPITDAYPLFYRDHRSMATITNEEEFQAIRLWRPWRRDIPPPRPKYMNKLGWWKEWLEAGVWTWTAPSEESDDSDLVSGSYRILELVTVY